MPSSAEAGRVNAGGGRVSVDVGLEAVQDMVGLLEWVEARRSWMAARRRRGMRRKEAMVVVLRRWVLVVLPAFSGDGGA